MLSNPQPGLSGSGWLTSQLQNGF
jgi:hypothetical protein